MREKKCDVIVILSLLGNKSMGLLREQNIFFRISPWATARKYFFLL
jgi:hypothetical protein